MDREHLTDRERQVITLLCLGMTNHEIGRSLHVSVDTVKTHRRKAYRVLGASTGAHAVFLALVRGDVLPGLVKEAS